MTGPASKNRPRHFLYSYIPAPPSLLPDPGGSVHVLSRHTENIADLLPGLRVAGAGPHVADPACPLLALGHFGELFEEEFRLRRVLRLVLHVDNVLPGQSRVGKHLPVEVRDKDIGVLPRELAVLLVDLGYPGVEPLLVDQHRRLLCLRDAFVFGCAFGKDATRQAEAEQYGNPRNCEFLHFPIPSPWFLFETISFHTNHLPRQIPFSFPGSPPLQIRCDTRSPSFPGLYKRRSPEIHGAMKNEIAWGHTGLFTP